MSKRTYTILQRTLINTFKTKPLKNIIELNNAKSNTTNLIKTMVLMKDPEFETLLPKFKEFYDITKLRVIKQLLKVNLLEN